MMSNLIPFLENKFSEEFLVHFMGAAKKESNKMCGTKKIKEQTARQISVWKRKRMMKRALKKLKH